MKNDTPSMESIEAKRKVTDLAPAEVLSAARLMGTRHMPYLSTAIWNLILKWQSGIGTMAVTKRGVCYIDPEILPVWGVYQTMVGLLHEVSHLLRGHSNRVDLALVVQGTVSPMVEAYLRKLANVAGDAEINDDLQDTGLQLLPTDVIPEKLECDRGLTMEEYMNKLIEKAEKNASGGDDAMDGIPQPGRDPNGNGCGSVSGNPHECEGDVDADGNPTNDGKAADGSGRSDAEVDRIRKEVAKAVKDHVRQHGAGSVPGGWDVWADQELTPPKVHWTSELQQECRYGHAVAKGNMDYRYGRPSRRQAGVGFGPGRPVLPTMVSYLPRAAFVVDTSGSMGHDEVAACMSEAQGVLDAMGTDITFGACDADIHEPFQSVRTLDEALAALKGGGGTRFNPVFDALAEMVDPPHILIFATDGGNFDTLPEHCPVPGLTVIWLLVGGHSCTPTFAGEPWGKMIWVGKDAEEVDRRWAA